MGLEFQGGPEAAGRRFAIVASSFNDYIVKSLVEGAQRALHGAGVRESDLDLAWCPGAVELPLVAKKLADSGRYDGLVALGCVIRGGTPHFDYVCSIAADGITRAALDSGIPIAFGVLTCDSMEQAIERAGPDTGNKGCEAADAAIEMVNLFTALDSAGQG
jgi:6,7-dimethyl-8-ribityllumazine synthase